MNKLFAHKRILLKYYWISLLKYYSNGSGVCLNKPNHTRIFIKMYIFYAQAGYFHYFSANFRVKIFLRTFSDYRIWSGAIIENGDRKLASFLVLGLSRSPLSGLSPWFGTIFLFLEQIAPLPEAHARTCCVDFCRWSAEKWRPKFRNVLCFWFTTLYMHICSNFTSVCSW